MFVCFAFSLLVLKVVSSRSVAGISLKTLQCYALVFAMRLSSILFYEGYLPLDRSGDWFYQASEVAALLLVLGLLFVMTTVHKRTYASSIDSFGAGGLPQQLGALYLVLPALVLAVILHPSLNNNWFTDTAWTFALYLEAVAILPQLFMFQRARDKEVEPYTANFVFCIAVARMLHFVFWLSSYQELNDRVGSDFSRRYPGYLVVLSQVRSALADSVFPSAHARASVAQRATPAARSLTRFSLPHSS